MNGMSVLIRQTLGRMLTPFTRSANSNKVPSRNQKKGSDKMLKYQCLHLGPPKLQNNVDKTRETIISFEHLPTSVTYTVPIYLQYFDDRKTTSPLHYTLHLGRKRESQISGRSQRKISTKNSNIMARHKAIKYRAQVLQAGHKSNRNLASDCKAHATTCLAQSRPGCH